jgi:hypothetical protein
MMLVRKRGREISFPHKTATPLKGQEPNMQSIKIIKGKFTKISEYEQSIESQSKTKLYLKTMNL